MGIVAKYSNSDINGILEQWIDNIVNSAVQALGLLGAKCVNYARMIPDPDNGGNGFKDHTGNLRSSIGFKIFVGKNIVSENYKQVLGGSEGIEKGRALADSVGAGNSDNQVMLVVTAGMEYAINVESLGRDVIASAELLAEQEWPKMKQKIDAMVKRQMKKFK